jgi:OHCU decarboxylase
MSVTLKQINTMQRDEFVQACGGFFEHSPWIAERAWSFRPFRSREQLHQRMVDVVRQATELQKLSLIRAHPDLVGKLAREGRVTRESSAEQAAARLVELTPQEVEQFERYNAAYRERFGFPFVICARENKKEAILAAFPLRLRNSREAEITAALSEIGKIARLRLLDVITE